MDRRSFLTASKSTDKRSTDITARTQAGLEAFPPNFNTSDQVHLLKRTLFGVKWTDINAFGNKTLSECVSTLLTPGSVPLPPVNNYNDANYTDANVAAGQTWVNAVYGDGTVNSRRISSFKAWWLGLMLNQSRSIHEKMVLFWHNHFATQTSTIDDARFIYKHNALLRTYALGNFKQMVKQITLDPGMLRYLNGYLNVKTSPDENYGRELQELFTIGKGPNSKYTEADVKAAAKVLTGYTVNTTTISSGFDATKHDTTNKQFSAFYNNKLITGKTGAGGATELDDMLDMIFATNECALFICRKIYRFFVYYNIDAATETNVIAPLAAIFRSNNYEIKPVLQALFSSDHFFDPVNRACLIKSPIDFTVGLCRETETDFPDTTDYVNQYYMWDYLRVQASNMQQNLGDLPNVAGWPAYYQEPQFHELWINSDTLPRRNQLSDVMNNTGYSRNGKKIVIDPILFASKLPNPADPNKLVDDTLTQLYSITVSQQLKDFLKSILLSGQISDHYWTDAWNTYIASPTNTMTKTIVYTRLQSLLKYLMDLAEYQLS